MPECMECGKGIKLTKWNVWNIFHLCGECEIRLRKEGRCPYCNEEFSHLRLSGFKDHIKNCKEIHKNL